MIFKILFVTMFITICSGAPPVHPQTKSNKAVYSQSFVREDVPMSYQYSAVHYYTPKKQDISNEVNPIKKINNPAPKPVSNNTIQFAPLSQNPTEYSYQTAPLLYTSIISDPSEYGKYELTENSAEPVLNKYNLEPKVMPTDAKKLIPSTYKPHMNHDIKIFHAPRLRANNYQNLNTPTPTTFETTPEVKTSKLNHADLFHLLEQQLLQQSNYDHPPTTEPQIFSHVRNLGVSVIPRHGTPLFTLPQQFYGNTPFQPIPRIAYHNKVHVVPEKQVKQAKILAHSPTLSHRLHLNTPKMH